jgi:hypothetical protein
MQDYAKIQSNFCNEQNIVICNNPLVVSDFFNGAATSMVHVINVIDLSLRSVEFYKKESEEEKK